MRRYLSLAVLSCLCAGAERGSGKFEGVWKSDSSSPVHAVLTILSDRPPRGTIARDSALNLYIQNPKIVKGALHFKTIDPNDGIVEYTMKLLSSSEAALTAPGAAPIALKRD